MRVWKPLVEGNYAGFYAEPEEQKDEGNRSYQRLGTYLPHIKGACYGVDEEEREEKEEGAQVSHDEVEYASFLGFLFLELRHDE